jgi:hypothetical protein
VRSEKLPTSTDAGGPVVRRELAQTIAADELRDGNEVASCPSSELGDHCLGGLLGHRGQGEVTQSLDDRRTVAELLLDRARPCGVTSRPSSP